MSDPAPAVPRDPPAAPTAPGSTNPVRRQTTDLARPAAAWLAVAVVVWRIQAVMAGRSLRELAAVLSPWAGSAGPVGFGAGRVAWDSGFYLRVAEHGYRLGAANEATFPGYPMAIRGVVAASGWDWATAAVVISAICGLAASLLCWRWLTLVGLAGRTRWVALLLVLLFPSAFMIYGVAYNEALVLSAVLGALICVERERWLLAGCCGAVATYSRPNMVVLPLVLIAFALLGSGAVQVARGAIGPRWQRARLRPRLLGVLVSFVGIGGYALWLWRHAGNPFYFAWLQTNVYGHSPLWHPYTWLKFPVWRSDLVSTLPDVIHELASLALIVAAVASIPTVARRLGPAYALFVALLTVVTWSGTYDLAPAGRYLLPVIPVLAATWAPALAARPRATVVALVASAAGTAYMAASFAGGGGLNW